MTSEVVSVPTRGVERWLAQQLSARLGLGPGRSDGVCANVDFPFPSRLVGGAATSPILTRELLYTAVPRTQEKLILVGTEEAVRAAVTRPVARASGLRRWLWGE